MRANAGRRRDQGSAAVVGLIIGLVVFSLTFTYVIGVTLDRQSEVQDADLQDYQGDAHALADVLFGKGAGWYGATPCPGGVLDTAAFTPDAFSDLAVPTPTDRFGLGDEGCGYSATDPRTMNNISFWKIQNLIGAGNAADPANGHVDYEEARHSLGLDDSGMDFHLRSAPVLASVRELLRTPTQDPNLRPLYLGDYEAGALGPSRPNIGHSGSAAQDAHYIYLNVTITQVLPTITSNFQVAYNIPLEKGTIVFTRNTASISLGAVTVSAVIAKTEDWAWADPASKIATYQVSDALGGLASGTIDLTGLSPDAPANGNDNVIVTLSLDRLTYATPFGASNKWPEAEYAGYRGDGSKVTSFDGDDIDLKVVGSGLIPYTKTYTNPTKNGQTLEDILLIAGSYTVEAWISTTAGTKIATDVFDVIDGALGGGTTCAVDVGDYEPQASTLTESGYVDILFANYDEGVLLSNYDDTDMPYLAAGDVFPDVKCALNQNLAPLLTDASGNPTTSRYTTLIVGSNVDHNAMTSGAAKNTIRDWVFGGGTLIVLGSSDQSVQWLQPLFHSALDTASGGLYTPDQNHPVLSVPNDLDYSSYEYATEWDYGAGAEALFTHVVTTGGESDILALSNPGAMGDGKVLLTSWKPYDLTADQATQCAEPITVETQCEALFMIHNLVTQSYRELFIDYGPSLPIGQPVAVTTRIVSVYHPELEVLIGMEVQVYVFGGS